MNKTPPDYSSYKRSLSISWKEGIPAALMQALLDNYMIPLGLFLNASNQEIGFLVAIPNLFSSLGLIFAVPAVRTAKSQLRFLVGATLLQAMLLIPICLLPHLKWSGSICFLILIVTGVRVLGNLIGTVWQSLVSHYLPPEERGKYFGWRSQIATLASVFGIAGGGVLLFFFKSTQPSTGFFLLFGAAALARFLSSWLMSKMQDVPLEHHREHDFTIWMFLARFKESNFVKFVFFVASVSLTTNLASPYFAVYMLKELHFTYLQYMVMQLLTVLIGWLAFPIWGRHADEAGNAKVLHVTSFLIPFVPILWLFSKNFGYIVLVELYAGFVWSGFNLCSINFIYDAVSPGKRTRCLSYFNLINGSAIFIGAALGGWLAEHLPMIHQSKLLTLFLLSGILRMITHFFLSNSFKEVRSTSHKLSSTDLFFSVVGIKPILGQSERVSDISWIQKFTKGKKK